MPHHQITVAERFVIGLLRRRWLSASAIATVLGRHRSTIGREVRRNISYHDGRTYRPPLADWYARGRRSSSRCNARIAPADLARVVALVREDWSPEQVAGWLGRHRILAISHETTYRYIWEDKATGGQLFVHLRCARKTCRKRYGAYDSRGRLDD